MQAHRVSKSVNAPGNDDPDLMAPVELETEQQALQLNSPLHAGSRADSRDLRFPVRQIAARLAVLVTSACVLLTM